MLLVNVNRGSCTNTTVVPNVSVQQVGCGGRGSKQVTKLRCGMWVYCGGDMGLLGGVRQAVCGDGVETGEQRLAAKAA